jgi:DNA-binding NtrC family response regulator
MPLAQRGTIEKTNVSDSRQRTGKGRFKMETLHTEIKKKLAKKNHAGEPKRILLIEKDKDSALSAVLAQEGYDVVHCASVQRAWSLVYPHRPHFIVLHFDNSNEAGSADFQECRALAQGVPIVLALSAQISRGRMKAPRGAAAVLAVSSTPESIRGALHSLEAALGNHGAVEAHS